jgi:flagellar biosynthesis protein FliQ
MESCLIVNLGLSTAAVVVAALVPISVVAVVATLVVALIQVPPQLQPIVGVTLVDRAPPGNER